MAITCTSVDRFFLGAGRSSTLISLVQIVYVHGCVPDVHLSIFITVKYMISHKWGILAALRFPIIMLYYDLHRVTSNKPVEWRRYYFGTIAPSKFSSVDSANFVSGLIIHFCFN